MKVTLEVVERFHEKWTMDEATGCWIWTGALAGKGYGEMKIPNTRQQIYAHRLSYLIHCGEIPEDILVCHSCDNPPCVKPSHLFFGKQADNLADMKDKDRHLYGEKNSKAKLTDEKVRRIHQLFQSSMSQGKIASSFGVAQTTVWKILHGQSWNHIFQEIYPEKVVAILS
jgi:hypothetical protein